MLKERELRKVSKKGPNVGSFAVDDPASMS
jgi:hypothetical protein